MDALINGLSLQRWQNNAPPTATQTRRLPRSWSTNLLSTDAVAALVLDGQGLCFKGRPSFQDAKGLAAAGAALHCSDSAALAVVLLQIEFLAATGRFLLVAFR